jgi:hypothetical protein
VNVSEDTRTLPPKRATRRASGKTAPTTRKTIVKRYCALAVYRETKYERERMKRREQR